MAWSDLAVHDDAPSPVERPALRLATRGPSLSGVVGPTTGKKLYKPGAQIPDELATAAVEAQASRNPRQFALEAARLGYGEPAINSMWKLLTGNTQATVDKPQGTTLWDALRDSMLQWDIAGFFDPAEARARLRRAAQSWAEYRANKGNR